MQRQTLIDSLIPVQKENPATGHIARVICETVKNVLPPTLLTLHIPHAPVLFSFLSLSHSCRVPWISALKFCSPILNGWMHQS